MSCFNSYLGPFIYPPQLPIIPGNWKWIPESDSSLMSFKIQDNLGGLHGIRLDLYLISVSHHPQSKVDLSKTTCDQSQLLLRNSRIVIMSLKEKNVKLWLNWLWILDSLVSWLFMCTFVHDELKVTIWVSIICNKHVNIWCAAHCIS